MLGSREKKFCSRMSQAIRILEIKEALVHACQKLVDHASPGDKTKATDMSNMISGPNSASAFWCPLAAVVRLYRPLYKFQRKYDNTSALACHVVQDWKVMDLVVFFLLFLRQHLMHKFIGIV